MGHLVGLGVAWTSFRHDRAVIDLTPCGHVVDQFSYAIVSTPWPQAVI